MGQQGRYNIGRVGALAIALGVGGVILALPAVADADTGAGNSGKTTSSAGKPATHNATKPGRTQKAPAAAKPSNALSTVSRKPVDRLATGNDPLAPVTEPLSFAVLAVTRRERLAAITSGTPALVPSASGTGNVTAGSTLNTAVRNFIDSHLPGLTPIADQLVPIVADGIQDLLNNGAVGAEVARLASNDVILQFVSTKVSNALGSYFGVPQSAGTVIGDAAADFVRNTLGNPGVQSALDVIAGAVRPTGEQYAAIRAGLAANDIAPLSTYLKSLVANSSPEIATFLSDATVQAALASATSHAVVDLTSGPALRTWLADIADGWVSEALGDNAGASAVGNAVGGAVWGLLSNTNAMQGLATVAGAAVEDLLSTPGVAAAAADFVTQFGTGVLGGTNWIDALDTAWQGLLADSAFRSALGPAAGDAVYSLTTNSDVVSALATTVTGLVNDLAGNAAVQTFVGELLGPTYGPTLASTLADPTSAAQLAATAGAVITSFLGQAGVAAALSTTADQIVTALLADATFSDALQYGLQSLVADPTVVAAFNATVPDALQGVLKAPAVQQVISTVAQGVVADLLQRTPLNNSAFAPAATQVTKAAVDALLANPAAQDLIGNLAGDILNGTPTAELVNTVIQQVVKSQALQIALGQAIGRGIGALLGDNPVAFAVGQLAGVAAALFFGFASGAAQLFGATGGGAAAASIPTGNSFLLLPVPVA
jgi:hypothetical protein